MAPFYMVRYGFKMALMYLVGIGNGLMMALYIGYGFKMALMSLVGIGNGLMMAPLYWTLIIFSISILQILYIVKEICIL